MKRLRFVVGFFVLSLILGGASLLISKNAAAEGVGVDKRIDLRQDRQGDRHETTADGVEDRQESREGRRDCVGDGANCRSENRQDKREDRQGRTGDRKKNRGDRLEKRF